MKQQHGRSLRPRDVSPGYSAPIEAYPEVAEVKEELWRHFTLLMNAFDYYAALFSEGKTADGEPDVYSITINGFLALVQALRMITPSTPHSVYQTIFAIVNATDATTAAVDRFNAEKALNRPEFLQVIVRCAVALGGGGGGGGGGGDVAMAIRSLVENHLCHLPPQAAQSSDAFRRRICYIEQVSTVLEAHKATLNAIYNRYAYANQSIHDIMRDDGMLSIGEWLTLIDHLGLAASGQISPHQAKMIFMWSRLRRYTNEHSNTIVTLANGWHAAAERAAIDKAGGSGPTAAAASPSKSSKGPDLTAIDKSERRLRHLSRHDFQEALVRMATMVALPTDEE